MSFTSLNYLFLFMPLVIGSYYFPIRKSQINFLKQRLVLIIANLLFYSLGSSLYSIFVILASVFVNYVLVNGGLKLKKGKILFAVAIIYNIALLLSFKYVNSLLPMIGMDLALPFPLGLSYFTFMAITYVVDSAKAKKGSSLFDAVMYLCFFCSVSAGPITQYGDFKEQFDVKRFDFDAFSNGVKRFAVGLIKKVAIADVLFFLVEKCFAGSVSSVLMAWIGVIAYTIQIYFDFSGYSDMAIGMGEILGYKLAENFNYPYTAKSISEFWKKWHISLTRFFTKYIYIPLGGNRVSNVHHIFNLFVVWLITGLWHGNNWTFIAWAMLHFAVQLIEKKVGIQKIPKCIGALYTILIVIIGWCFFKSDSIPAAFDYMGNMFGFSGLAFCNAETLDMFKSYGVPFVLGCIFCFPVMKLPVMQNKFVSVLKNILLVVCFALSVFSMFGVTALAPLYGGF